VPDLFQCKGGGVGLWMAFQKDFKDLVREDSVVVVYVVVGDVLSVYVKSFQCV
jgi:hypothetical protein